MTSSESYPAYVDHHPPKAISPLSANSPVISHTRTFSMSSDRPSTTGSGFGGTVSMPSTVSPEPNYIAPPAASQIVTNDHDSQSDSWFDQHGLEPSGETALVAPAAMRLVNRFLDQLLFSFLATSKSVSLASLRPAVFEVLKPKLAKGAINGADQELNEYLGGGEDEELLAFHNGLEPTGHWDLELVWKRTRLRCMVYSSLGDMEEEDEDHYTEEGELQTSGTNRFSNPSGVVSPAVAIFLTSILEFMGEQALVVAGQAAYHRLRAKHEKDEQDGTYMVGDIAERVVVTDMDMERIALDRTMGRLWRGWKKRIRSPNQSVSMGRSFSRESLKSRINSRRGSATGEPAVPTVEEMPRKPSVTESMIHENAASIALPMGDDDVREIEIPGLAHHSDDEDEGEESDSEVTARRPRPHSMIAPRKSNDIHSLETSEPRSPVFLAAVGRKRSNSVPTPSAASFNVHKRQRSLAKEADIAPATASNTEEGVEVAPLSQKDVAKDEKPAESSKIGLIAGVVAGVGAVGAAAIAGITAAAKGLPPQTHAAADSDPEDEDVQIMTSSRVSIGGRRSPEEPTNASRASSVRPRSVHSLRLVDIPHSPTRSRQGSVGSTDYMAARSSSLSRKNSVHSPISPIEQARAMTPVQRTATASPIARSVTNHQARGSAGSVVPEMEKQRDITSKPRAPAVIVPERSPLREKPTLSIQRVQNQLEEDADEKPVMSANTPYFGEPHFVLSAPPTTWATRDRDASAVQTGRSHESPVVKTPDSSAPLLTPLREMMEVAPDTSDEASSVAPSVETATSVPSHYRSYEGGRSPEQPRVLPQGSSPQRLKNSHRSSPSQSRREDETPKPYSLAKADRQIHTSGSSTSSGSHKVRPIRTSEDSHRNGSGKSFEDLIRSDQTIQYTLTPQTMRQIEGPESPRNGTMYGEQNGRNEVHRRRSNSNKSAKSLTKPMGLNSNPLNESRGAPVPPAKPYKSVLVPHSTQNTANMGSRVRPNAPQPRDARVERDSVSDFADFIRSTGPPGVSLSQPVNGSHVQNGLGRKPSVVRSIPIVPAVSEIPRSSSSSATRRLQAREAVIPKGDQSSDLIDFIRQGPPSERSHDNPRISRTVAPFRTTMDSDQMSGAIGGRATDLAGSGPRDSTASGVTNGNSMQSMNSSINSQSALLNTHKAAAPNHASQRSNAFDEEDPMPKRKQRRVRDPYAIDFSDEEEEVDAPPVRKPQRHEESLIDFLNNVPPPSTTSVFDNVPKPVGKKPSAQNLMSRFGRNGSTDAGTKFARKDSQPHSSSASISSSSRVNGHAPKTAPAHIPISVSIPSSGISNSTTAGRYNGVSSQPADRDNYVSRLDGERNPSTRPRVQQKAYQPRDASTRPTRSGASELADFLKNTPPPPGNGMQQPNYGVHDDGEKSGSGSGFVRSVFGRRKKAAA